MSNPRVVVAASTTSSQSSNFLAPSTRSSSSTTQALSIRLIFFGSTLPKIPTACDFYGESLQRTSLLHVLLGPARCQRAALPPPKWKTLIQVGTSYDKTLQDKPNRWNMMERKASSSHFNASQSQCVFSLYK